MPGPQFAAPRPVPRRKTPRRFTLAQANQTLPLVKRIVGDIVQAHEQVAGLQMKLASLDATQVDGVQAELDALLQRLNAYVHELEDIGCELKDYQIGLVDFIGRHEGRDVNLCWKLGEEQIDFWHEFHTGFAGRQPVATLCETE